MKKFAVIGFRVCRVIELMGYLGCRAGIVPLDNTSDISGPLARSVEDVARMLEALAGPDPADPLTLSAPKNVNRTSNFTRYLNADGLKVSIPWLALSFLINSPGESLVLISHPDCQRNSLVHR